MIKKSALLVFMGLSLLAGCSTMNSEFSCNETAWDRCLDIEEVDAMTRFADLNHPPPKRHEKKGFRNQMKAAHQTNMPAMAGTKSRDGIVLFNNSRASGEEMHA